MLSEHTHRNQVSQQGVRWPMGEGWSQVPLPSTPHPQLGCCKVTPEPLPNEWAATPAPFKSPLGCPLSWNTAGLLWGNRAHCLHNQPVIRTLPPAADSTSWFNSTTLHSGLGGGRNTHKESRTSSTATAAPCSHCPAASFWGGAVQPKESSQRARALIHYYLLAVQQYILLPSFQTPLHIL